MTNLRDQLEQLADATGSPSMAEPVTIRRRGDELRRAERARAAVAVAAAATVAVAATLAVHRHTDSRPEPAGGIDGWQVTRTIDVPRWGSMIYADGSLWVVDAKDRAVTDAGHPAGSVYQIDPATGRVLDRVDGAVGGWPATGGGAIWLCTAAGDLNQLTRMDLRTHQVTTSRPAQGLPHGAAFVAGELWVADTDAGDLVRTDPMTGRALQRIPVGDDARGRSPDFPVAAGSTVWATTDDGHLIGVDAPSGRVVTRFALPMDNARILDSHGPTLYISGAFGDRLLSVDVSTPREPQVNHELTLPSDPVGVAQSLTYQDGALWLAQLDPDQLLKLDPNTLEVTGAMPLSGVDRSSPSPVVITSGGGAVFVRIEDQVLQLAPKPTD